MYHNHPEKLKNCIFHPFIYEGIYDMMHIWCIYTSDFDGANYPTLARFILSRPSLETLSIISDSSKWKLVISVSCNVFSGKVFFCLSPFVDLNLLCLWRSRTIYVKLFVDALRKWYLTVFAIAIYSNQLYLFWGKLRLLSRLKRKQYYGVSWSSQVRTTRRL